MTAFTAAVVQLASGTDVAANVAAMEHGIRQAALKGATYIQTPEMTGLVQRRREAFFRTVVAGDKDPAVAVASRLAAELKVTVHLGSTPIRVTPKKAANRSFVFGPDGAQLATYDKIHMFDVDLDNGESWRESSVYRPGNRSVTATINGTLFGMAICYDCRFPELFTVYGRAGAEVLTAPSCFTRQTGRAHWHTLLRARAIENGAYMVAAAQGGDLQDGRETYGHSLIIGPWGDVIAEVAGEDPGVALAEIDTNLVAQARLKVPNLRNHRPFSMPGEADDAEVVA